MQSIVLPASVEPGGPVAGLAPAGLPETVGFASFAQAVATAVAAASGKLPGVSPAIPTGPPGLTAMSSGPPGLTSAAPLVEGNGLLDRIAGADAGPETEEADAAVLPPVVSPTPLPAAQVSATVEAGVRGSRAAAIARGAANRSSSSTTVAGSPAPVSPDVPGATADVLQARALPAVAAASATEHAAIGARESTPNAAPVALKRAASRSAVGALTSAVDGASSTQERGAPRSVEMAPAQVEPNPAPNPAPAEVSRPAAAGVALPAESATAIDAPTAGLTAGPIAPGISAPAVSDVAPVDTEDGPQLVARLAETVESAVLRGKRELRLALNPPDLGHLEVRIANSKTGLRVTFEASSVEALELLQRQLPALQAALEARDLRVDRLDVHRAPETNAELPDGSEPRGQDGETGNSLSGADRDAGLGSGSDAANSVDTPSVADASIVDIRV